MKLSVMSAKHGVSVVRLRQLEQYGLCFEDDGLDIDALHKRALYDAGRSRVSSYTVAYLARSWTEQTPEWDAREQSLKESYSDGGEMLQEGFDAVAGDYIGQERLADGADILNRIVDAPGNLPDHAALELLATWAKKLLNTYHTRETDHNFLAARLLASVPLVDMPIYPKIVATAIARLRWHKYLDGYFRLEKDANGKAKTIYFAKPLDL